MDGADAVTAARSVAVVAAEQADETERGRRLAAPVVDALEASGLNRLVSPTAIGGDAAPPEVMVRAVKEIAMADAYTAWCAGIGMGSNFLSALLSEAAAKELFTELDRGAAGPFAPGGRAVADGDGFRLTGRWAYASNCQQAPVMGAGAMLFDGDALRVNAQGFPDAKLAFIAADRFEIDETWNTVGLRGTGSHDVVVTDITLPAEHLGGLFDPMWPDDALFRLRSFDVLGPCLAAVPLGIGRAALDVVERKAVADAGAAPIPGPRPRFADDPLAQSEMARAEVRLRGVESLLVDALGQSYACALRGDTPPRVNTALIGLANCEALAAGRHAVDTAVKLMGSASVREGAALDRLRRDIDTAGAHIMFSHLVATGLGRELAGIPTHAFPYLPPPSD